MAFTVQDDDGLVSEANAYAPVAYVRAYHLDRGLNLSALTDSVLEAAIVKATQYIDSRYTFLGDRRNNDQTTEWPRRDAYDRSRNLINGIPRAVKQAMSELAYRAASAPLISDPERDSSGRVVLQKSEAVGPIKEDVTYATGGAYALPEYPAVDLILQSAGLIRTGLTGARA